MLVVVDVRVPTSFPYFSFSFWVLQNPHTENYIPRLPDDNAHEKLVTVECYFKMEKKCYIIYRCKHFLESLDGEKICTVPLGKRMLSTNRYFFPFWLLKKVSKKEIYLTSDEKLSLSGMSPPDKKENHSSMCSTIYVSRYIVQAFQWNFFFTLLHGLFLSNYGRLPHYKWLASSLGLRWPGLSARPGKIICNIDHHCIFSRELSEKKTSYSVAITS